MDLLKRITAFVKGVAAYSRVARFSCIRFIYLTYCPLKLQPLGLQGQISVVYSNGVASWEKMEQLWLCRTFQDVQIYIELFSEVRLHPSREVKVPLSIFSLDVFNVLFSQFSSATSPRRHDPI